MRLYAKPELLNNSQAADFLDVSPGTLNVWRCTKRYDLPYLRVGRKILYDINDLRAFLEARKVRR
jgi:Helix-turn-helix domain